jgi:hypothetical protein
LTPKSVCLRWLPAHPHDVALVLRASRGGAESILLNSAEGMATKAQKTQKQEFGFKADDC